MGAFFLACLNPTRSRAQAVYYRTIPIGERAIGLGGAFTGIANDPSATYYNPAGLMTGGRFQLLGSLTSLVYTRRNIDNAFDAPTASGDFTSKGTTTLPAFVGTAIKFGRRKFGDRQFAIAYSTLEVAREAFGAGLNQVEPEGTLDVRVGRSYVMRWWGLTFSAQATKKIALGISGFVARQRGNSSEDIGLATGGTLNSAGLRVGGQSVTSATSVGVTGWDLVFRLGALWRINSVWQLGFMFQPPGAPVGKDGNVFRRTTTSLPDMDDTFFLFSRDDLSTRTPIPFELRTGFEYKVNALTVLAFDVSVNGPVRDRPVFDRPEELEGFERELGVYFSNSTERRWTPNLAIGADHIFGKVVVAGGLFTNISAAPNVPETTAEFTPDQINVFGAAFSIGVDARGYRLTVGATGYYGRGDALSFTLDSEARVGVYRRTKASVAAVVLYLAGAVAVADKGARAAQEKYKERRAKKKSSSQPVNDEKGEEVDEAEGQGLDLGEAQEPDQDELEPTLEGDQDAPPETENP